MNGVDIIQLVEQLHQELLDHPDLDPQRLLGTRAPLLPASAQREILRRVEARRHGFGVLDDVLGDPEVTEVMINGPGPVWVERRGRIEPSGLRLDRNEIDHLVERVVAPIGRRVDRRSPCVDGRLPDGSRINVVVPPVALDGPYLTIRRFSVRELTLEAFGEATVGAVLEELVQSGANVLVSGGTGAGKTTLLNALAGLVESDARIITVEDAAELRLHRPHVVR